MIDKTTATETLMERLGKLPVGHCLELRTYKRNRSVLFIRTGPDAFVVEENGFHHQTFEVAEAGIRRLFGKILKREFPRSNKIRLYQLGEYSDSLKSLHRKKL